MIFVTRPSAQSSARVKGIVAANECIDRLADTTRSEIDISKLRASALKMFTTTEEGRADINSLVVEWTAGFDKAIKERDDYFAAGGAAAIARTDEFKLACRRASAVLAMLSAVAELPDAEQQQMLAACAKLAHELDNGLTKLAGGAA